MFAMMKSCWQLLLLPALLGVATANAQEDPPPLLSGHHFRITIVAEDGFVEFNDNGEPSGYLVNMVTSLANRANFSYELLPPSGFGSKCGHSTEDDDGSRIPYDPQYQSQYLCGQSDVNDLPKSNYTTDMYLSLFYLSPQRLLENKFSMAFQPPVTGALTLFGTATGFRNFNELTEQQAVGAQRPICVQQNTAYAQYLKQTFPELKTVGFPGGPESHYNALKNDLCDAHVSDNPIATRFVLLRSQQGQCHIREKVRLLYFCSLYKECT